MLQFGLSVHKASCDRADLSKDGPIGTLAWIIRHFVPLVVDDPKKFWGSMLASMPLAKYMTITDLAFAVLVLEHNMMKWRSLLQYELETGQQPTREYCSQQSVGLLYSGGISGEDGKRRFRNLCTYFFYNFCADKCPQKDRNAKKLQATLNNLARKDSDSIKSSIRTFGSYATTPVVEVQEDVLHRVFYYCYLC